MKSHIDLHRMRLIVEIARRESISAAARSLGLSQPALTRCVAEVEAALGIEVFARSPHGVSTTEEGQRFVAGAMQILGEVESLVSGFPSQTGPLTGSIRIGVCPAGYGAYARSAVAEIAKRNPRVQISLFSGPAEALCPRLLYGELDLIVGSSSYLERWRELDVDHIRRLQSICVLRRKHPLAASSNVAEIDVLRFPAILWASVDPVHSDLAVRHLAHGLTPFHPHYVTDDIDLIMRLVRETDAYFPVMTLDPGADAFGSQYLKLHGVLEIPPHYLSIARARNRRPSRIASLFIDQFAIHRR
jgi:DNA-binding transcriptional LysR family regulator